MSWLCVLNFQTISKVRTHRLELHNIFVHYFLDTPSNTSEDFFTPLTMPILPRHRATPTNEERPGVSTQDGKVSQLQTWYVKFHFVVMKARMKFMITPYHPEEGNKTFSSHMTYFYH